MVRGRDACWEHCVLVDATRQKVKCNYCQREFSGGVYRMKFHLAQIKNKDIVPCPEVPEDVRDQIHILLNTPKKQKTPKKLKVGVEVQSQQLSSSPSGGVQLNNGPMRDLVNTSPSFLSPRPMLRSPECETDDDQDKNQKQIIADTKIAAFFYHNAIPFSAAYSIYYQEMVDAVAESEVGYIAPSSEKLGTTLLEKVKGDINESNEGLRHEWKENGCTILCNCCSKGGDLSLLVFSATCSKGSLFLKSADISSHKNDGHYLFELIESVVLEVGLENAVQVITDSTDCYVMAGQLLMSKYPTLFWSPCASHCIKRMLEDLSELEWVSTVLKEAKVITTYMYSHQLVSKMIRKFTGRTGLTKPKVASSIINFLSLRSIIMEEDNIKFMFTHPEWLLSTFSKESEAQSFRSTLHSWRFWNSAKEVVNITEPLIKVLRIVDGDMLATGYIYEGMERAKAEIKEYYKGVEEKYIPIWEIIDRRWNLILCSPLHLAATFLNPSIFHSRSFKIDSRIRNGFQDGLKKIVVEESEKVEVTKELPLYISAQGALGTEFAIMGRKLNLPGDWWMTYGYEIPVLQSVAIRILTQTCSSHWCRWNWSTFESLHKNKYNTSESDKFRDLVFVHCNLWLKEIFKKMKGRQEPIVYDQLDVDTQWPSESVCSSAVLDESLCPST